jgi:hypothetical protein
LKASWLRNKQNGITTTWNQNWVQLRRKRRRNALSVERVCHSRVRKVKDRTLDYICLSPSCSYHGLMVQTNNL